MREGVTNHKCFTTNSHDTWEGLFCCKSYKFTHHTPEAYSNRHVPSNEFPFSYSASSLSFPWKPWGRTQNKRASVTASVMCEQRHREPLIARASEDAFESCVWSLINNKVDKRSSFITFTSSSMLPHLLHCGTLRFSILTKKSDSWEFQIFESLCWFPDERQKAPYLWHCVTSAI